MVCPDPEAAARYVHYRDRRAHGKATQSATVGGNLAMPVAPKQVSAVGFPFLFAHASEWQLCFLTLFVHL